MYVSRVCLSFHLFPFKHVPQVVKLDLQHNELKQIPRSLLELPSLHELNLSHNQLHEIPDVPEWSSVLSVLDLSHNQLTNLPLNAVASSIRNLNICHNQFRSVPLCICSFTTLHTLDLSDNPDILTLPSEMGRLTSLNRLHLRNLKDLNDPPRNMQRDTRDCIRYLNSKLRCAKGFFRIKLMLVGCANRGKTTLVARLQGKDCGNEATVGVDVSDWQFRPGLGRKVFHFSIWDFGGQEEYYATHQCFLSQRSLYLLLFNLKKGEEGVRELKPWLNNIALRAPKSCIIIVGTHLDEVKDDERDQVFKLLHKVAELAGEYRNQLNIAEIMPVGLKNRLEHIGTLKDAIYNHAANYKHRGQAIMGQKIPASYHALDRQIELIQQEVRRETREPIMHAEEFKTMVQQMNLTDIQDDDELKTATLFLTDVGTLLHYDDRSHNLHELYFIDPRWLCDMMSKVVTIKERNPFVKNGILLCENIPHLFRDERFPWQYFEQYLTLLDRFEIALPLDNRRILIPSMLPETRPKNVDIEDGQEIPFYSRFIVFNSNETPPGFWSRLLSRIMHSVSKVCYALNKTSPQNFDDSLGMNFRQSAGLSASSNYDFPRHSDADDVFDTSSSEPTTSSNASTNSPSVSLPTSNAPLSIRQLFSSFPTAYQQSTVSASYDVRSVCLVYWKLGLLYKDPDVSFRVESLLASNKYPERKDGVLICVSTSQEGKRIMGQLVDIVVALVSEWYPGLADSSSSVQQKVPCYECLKLRRSDPFKFNVDQCLPEVQQSKGHVKCGYSKDPQVPNHMVALQDIVPDLLMHDIDEKFLLSAEDISYQEDESSLLGVGGYGKVYRGKCLDKSVAIKKYLTKNEKAFAELRSEAKFLQKSHHPCLVCLVGVCLRPYMALVLEEAPLGSLEKPLLKRNTPIHRVTLFRIASQVAAGLRFLHSTGVIFRDLKAANILLWTLDHGSLCHCKVTDFGIATHLSPVGARGLQGTKGFIAPEVLYVGKRKQRSVYNHTADIFSFSMLLYQMIARRHPYHNIKPERIDTAVESGERPQLQDVENASSAYYYLTKLMKVCWANNPLERPTTDDILSYLCTSVVQSIMSVKPLKGWLTLRKACAITPHQFTEAQKRQSTSELWICCDGKDGTEITMYSTDNLTKVNSTFIKDNQIQCICVCKDHVWVGSRAGIDFGVIDIFSVGMRDLVHNIRMRENSVSCITCSDTHVYLGTLEGYCFSFSIDIRQIQANAKPRYKYVSEHAVLGIVVTSNAGNEFVWVSHTRYIYFLKPDNLAQEGSLYRGHTDAYVGQLSVSPTDSTTVWSAHIGGNILSAWDATHKTHRFNIEMSEHMKSIDPGIRDDDIVITAMTLALDTVWVGMASGHILLFANQEILTWYRPYNAFIRFLTAIPCMGPSKKEECMVITGAKDFRSPLPDRNPVKHQESIPKLDEKGQPNDSAGVLLLWEAFSAKMTRQMKLIESKAPHFFNNHDSIRKLIRTQGLEFKDGTQLLKGKDVDGNVPPTSLLNDQYRPTDVTQSYEILPYEGRQGTPPQNRRTDSIRYETFLTEQRDSMMSHSPSSLSSPMEPVFPIQPNILSRTRTFSNDCDVFDVDIVALSGEENTTVRVTCPRPTQLKVLLSELETNGNIPQDKCRIEYCDNLTKERVKITTQKELEVYLVFPNRPQLFLST